MNKETAKKFVRVQHLSMDTWAVTYPAETIDWDYRTLRSKEFRGSDRYNEARKFGAEMVSALCNGEQSS
jgi:hypothetical protein